VYDLELSRRLSIIKFSRATSRVKLLNGEKTNVSRAISVLVLRELKNPKDEGGSTLRTRTEMVLETLVFSSFNHLTRPVAQENFIIVSAGVGDVDTELAPRSSLPLHPSLPVVAHRAERKERKTPPRRNEKDGCNWEMKLFWTRVCMNFSTVLVCRIHPYIPPRVYITPCKQCLLLS
jgi:hypothetical protein